MTMLRFARAFPFAALAVSCLPLTAQLTTTQITFRNQGAYSQADLEQAAGLHAGEKTSHTGVQAAAQRLMDTGFFDDIKVDSKGTSSTTEIIFTLTPEAPRKGSVVGFENFVWFTPEEMQATIHKAAPLFQGRLPEGGSEAEVISKALQSALAAKGVNGTVSYEVHEPSTQQPKRVTEYTVDPPMLVNKVSVNGVPSELAAAEKSAASGLAFSAYNEGLTGDTISGALLTPALDAGYLDAKLSNLQRTVREGRQVDVTATLLAGAVYRVAKISTTAPTQSNGISPMDEAANASTHTQDLKPGDIASRKQLQLTMQPIEDAYRSRGYMDVYVDPMEILDPATRTVSYNLTVTPGGVYHLHSVTPIGLSPAATTDFNRAWVMKTGDVYNALYVSHLIENNSALRALAAYKATFKAESDPSTHLVDLTIRFEPNNISSRH